MSFNVKNPAEFSGVQNLVVEGHSQLVDVSCTKLGVTGLASFTGGINAENFSVADGTGNVGIGGASSTENLKVTGTAYITGTTTVGNTLQIGLNDNSTTVKSIRFGGTYNDNTYDHCVIENRMYSEGTEKSELLLYKGNDQTNDILDRIRLRAGAIQFDTYPSDTLDRTAENIRMTINSSGNVGIGTTTPTTTLDVNGNIQGGNMVYFGNSGSAEPFFNISNDRSLNQQGTHFGWNTWINGSGGSEYINHSQFSGGNQGHYFLGRNTNQTIGYYNCYASSFTPSSDDRIKKDETFITNAIQIITKLRPQTYKKYSNLDCCGNYMIESGLIAQEIYYDVPELRHLVNVPIDADISGHIDTSSDPSIDPDYSNWGSTPATVNYNGFIAYLIKAVQEQQENYNDLLARIEALEK